jgi:hypothetical protein
MKRTYTLALTCLFELMLTAAPIAPPQVPPSLRPPDTEAVVLKALGKGKQIYACQAKAGSKTEFEWVLARPQADLFDAYGKKIARHFEGPTWEAPDGSKVIGQVQQKADAPNGAGVPWLLLRAKTTQGTGIFGRVTFIQRVETSGGLAPASGCDSTHAGKEQPVDYQAFYYFYAAK